MAKVGSFHDFAEVCESLSQTSSRIQLAQWAGEFLARLSPEEAPIAARFMVGRALEQGGEKRLQVSGRTVWRVAAELASAADQGEEIFAAATDFGEAVEIVLRLRPTQPAPQLTLGEVHSRFNEIAAIEGRNSRGRKLTALHDLFERATTLEGKYLAKVLIGEMRHGLSEGLMLDAIARMANRPITEIRRAHQLDADLGRLVRGLHAPAARAIPAPASEPSLGAGDAGDAPASPAPALPAGGGGTAATPPSPLRPKPIRPMLAAPAPSVPEAFRILDHNLALEHKLDGARVQIHCDAGRVSIFSRRLNEITTSLPEVVELMGRIAPRHLILDGEVIATDRAGGPVAFQELMRRFGRIRDIEKLRNEQPVRLFLFDIMAQDGNLLIDLPYAERYELLAELASSSGFERAGRIVPISPIEAENFYTRAIADGYEGIMAKALDSLYTPGARGRGWLKIKTARTLDLVIVAADWGYGRRHGWLSNYHLAARDEESLGFVEVGKTFKGLTDTDFQEMTDRLLSLKIAETRGTVTVRPEVVVEVAYSDISRSPQYVGGMALRFARIVGIRTDKNPEEADTIATVAAAFDRQLVKPNASKSS